eukprot:CAMPEP_0185833660 /NCGR_PEP_ID=MMETSP1353-20130828/3303_1 /TAXON_ID=1077150 /ORGANISM="Erythrolobus australicus, Strain CCMP3124" /LENGTH=162 /DNA_ID=CAMNT_0028531975 /DNA_START=175 /DNA_END=663 /DNA_ORIENTATION=+
MSGFVSVSCWKGATATSRSEAMVARARPTRVACSARSPLRMQIPNSPSELFRQNRANSLSGGRAAGAAVLERPRVEETTQPKTDPGKMYKVYIYNDDNHTKSYVVSVLMKVIPDMTKARATEIMESAHKHGSGMVGVWIFEVAEMYCDMLRTAGIQSDIIEA